MVLALGITRDLGAYHALRVGLPLGPAHPADAHTVDALDRQRAGARAIVRADGVDGVERQARAPERDLSQNIWTATALQTQTAGLQGGVGR